MQGYVLSLSLSDEPSRSDDQKRGQKRNGYPERYPCSRRVSKLPLQCGLIQRAYDEESAVLPSINVVTLRALMIWP